MTHTPGPWEFRRANKPVDGEYDYGISAEIDGEDRCIAEAFGRCATAVRLDAYANARLIAHAPNLLEALQAAERELRNEQAINSDNRTSPQVLEYIQAAIAEATC